MPVHKTRLLHDKPRAISHDRTAAKATLLIHLSDAVVTRNVNFRSRSLGVGLILHARLPWASIIVVTASSEAVAVAVDAGRILSGIGRGIIVTAFANHSVDVVPTGSGREAKSTL